jgi:phospholipid/cholesterol/gamma-HCH transport system substrate-binding protein
MRRLRRLAGLAVAGALTLSGCGFSGLYGVPLPGGPDLGDHPYRIQAQFVNVLDLVPQSAVRVNDVPVGKVEKIELEGWTARITMVVNGDVKLPANAHAELRQTSLLGEKFVALSPPTDAPPEGSLDDGALIKLASTNRNPEVEEVLSALSLLLNGGGVEQLQVITRELNKALTGRETELRSLLTNLNTFIGGLDRQKAQITRALDNIDKLSATLAANRVAIGRALDTLPAALKVLSDQRGQLTTMLTSLAKLGVTGTRVINASRDDVLADLALLKPTLQQLADAGDALPKSLGFLLTFPFPDTALRGIKGDYANAYITLDADVLDILNTLTTQKPTQPGAGATPGLPAVPALPSLPTLPGAGGGPTLLPGLPLPGLGGSTTQSDQTNQSGVPNLLGILLGGGP